MTSGQIMNKKSITNPSNLHSFCRVCLKLPWWPGTYSQKQHFSTNESDQCYITLQRAFVLLLKAINTDTELFKQRLDKFQKLSITGFMLQWKPKKKTIYALLLVSDTEIERDREKEIPLYYVTMVTVTTLEVHSHREHLNFLLNSENRKWHSRTYFRCAREHLKQTNE